MKVPSFDSTKSLLVLGGVALIAYAAFKAYKGAQQLGGQLQGAYTGAVARVQATPGNVAANMDYLPGGTYGLLPWLTDKISNWGSSWQADSPEERARIAADYFRNATPGFIFGEGNDINAGNVIPGRRYDDLGPPVIDYATRLPGWSDAEQGRPYDLSQYSDY